MFRLSRLESNRNSARTDLHGLFRGLKIDLAVAQGPGPREGSSISYVDLVAVIVDVEHIKSFFWEPSVGVLGPSLARNGRKHTETLI